MEFRQLRSFVEVVRQGSFTQAAQVRHASQSTISKQVAQLEQSLGVQVLERNGPHVRLTDAGAVVFRRAEEMLRLRRDLLSELGQIRERFSQAKQELQMELSTSGDDPNSLMQMQWSLMRITMQEELIAKTVGHMSQNVETLMKTQ